MRAVAWYRPFARLSFSTVQCDDVLRIRNRTSAASQSCKHREFQTLRTGPIPRRPSAPHCVVPVVCECSDLRESEWPHRNGKDGRLVIRNRSVCGRVGNDIREIAQDVFRVVGRNLSMSDMARAISAESTHTQNKSIL